jgi:hypothetical protein
MFPDQASDFLLTQLTRASHRLGASLQATASKLDGTAPDAEAALEPAGGWVRSAAETCARAGSYLENAEGEELLQDLAAVTRRRPWTVGLGALALGFTAGRFVKGAEPRGHRD